MVTSPQAGLFPAGGNDCGPALSALELAASGGVELIKGAWAEVGHGVALEPCPQVLHWIEIGRVRGQEGHLYIAIGGVQVLPHQPAAVRLQAVPDDQQGLLQVRPQRLEEFHVLLLLDRALVKPEHAVRSAESGDHGDVGPVEVELDDGCLSLGGPGAYAGRTLAQAALVDENDHSPLALGFF